jgi:hypothetical protein
LVFCEIAPLVRSSASTGSYCDASVSTATSFQFFAPLRTIGRAADVDVLDRVLQRAACLGHRLLEGVQVHHQDVDGADRVPVQRRHVVGMVTPRQQAAMDLGMQGLDPAVQHFGKTGELRPPR